MVLGLVIAALVAVILLILVGAYWESFTAFSPRDRAAGNQALQATADLLAARFRDREAHAWAAPVAAFRVRAFLDFTAARNRAGGGQGGRTSPGA